MFTDNFDTYSCIGDSIHCKVDGINYTAYLVHDQDSRPADYECYSPDDVKLFYADEWHYVGLVIKAERNGWAKDNLASSWGFEVNLGGNNDYLLEVANDILQEAILEASK